MTAPKDYLSLYAAAADARVPNHVAACWESAEVQRRRFEVIADAFPLEGKRVLDAGCSRGDLAQFLVDERIDFDRYVGVDALPEVIAFASKRRLPRCEFYRGDLLEDAALLAIGPPDVIAISGTLNTLLYEQARRLIERAWEATREALVFNFLSDRTGEGAPEQLPPIYRHPTLELIAWALERTPRVTFRQDYLPRGHDATIAMLKDPGASSPRT